MSKESVKEFYDKLASDTELQKKIMHAPLSDNVKGLLVQGVCSVATESGYDITPDDIKEYEAERTKPEGLVGALADWDDCFCAIGGGGDNWRDNCICGCIVGGGGPRDRDGFYLYCVIAGRV